MPPIFTSVGAGSIRTYGLIRRSAVPIPVIPVITNSVQYLLVAGGGGAGGGTGGGGGGGGLMIGVFNVSTQNVYNVAVGAGGSAGLGDGANGGRGGVSYFGINRSNNSFTVIGGGAGIHDSRTSPVNCNGGSGGGGGYNSPAVGASPGGIVQPGSTPRGTNIGNNGGSSSSQPPFFAGAGGGGANGAGGGAFSSNPQGGTGGAAFFTAISGSNTAYSGGGGGGTNNLVARGGSNGATGGNSTNDQTGTNGFTNRGGGAGAAGTNSGTSGGGGGSGIVILRWPISSNLGNATLTTGSPTYTEVSTDRVYTFTGSGTIRWGESVSITSNITSVTIYSVWGGGTRSANYTVDYSDDNVNWTTAFAGVMQSTGCGLFNGSYSTTPISNYGTHRYWRYVVGSTVSGHHPRVSRIYLSDANATTNWDLVTFTSDNCSDSGTIPGAGNSWSIDTLVT
jgi:hypothetical protein